MCKNIIELKPSKINISKVKEVALNELKNKNNVVVLKANKGNVAVVLETSEY